MEPTTEELQAKCIELANWIAARPDRDKLSEPVAELVAYILAKAALENPAMFLAGADISAVTVAVYWLGYRNGLQDANVKKLLGE